MRASAVAVSRSAEAQVQVGGLPLQRARGQVDDLRGDGIGQSGGEAGRDCPAPPGWR
jgi:hypothetical protein